MTRITHRHIIAAVDRLNQRRGLSYPEQGYLQYSEIGGWGTYAPSFYACSGNGVTNVASLYRGRTLRETLAKVEQAS